MNQVERAISLTGVDISHEEWRKAAAPKLLPHATPNGMVLDEMNAIIDAVNANTLALHAAPKQARVALMRCFALDQPGATPITGPESIQEMLAREELFEMHIRPGNVLKVTRAAPGVYAVTADSAVRATMHRTAIWALDADVEAFFEVAR